MVIMEAIFTFYYVIEHIADINMVMSMRFNFGNKSKFIHVDKSKVVISNNPLIDEPSLKSINISVFALGKYIWFWIWVKDSNLNMIFSEISKPININNFSDNKELVILNVDSFPFNRVKGLITKNVWDNNSKAFENVKEFERREGTSI